MDFPNLLTPEYDTTLPSGRNVKYRPFLVKEEKILMMLKETDEFSKVLTTMKKVVKSCLKDDISFKDMSYSDLEYLFIMMRAKSMGETVTVTANCDKCGKSYPCDVDVSLISTNREYPKDTSVILNDGIGVVVKPVSVDAMPVVAEYSEKNPISVLYFVIEAIVTPDQMHKFSEMTQDDQTKFIDSLTLPQLQKIMVKVEEFPKCAIKTKNICPHCGEENEIVVEGLENFFT